MSSLRIQSKVIGTVKKPNCKFTCLQVLQLLVLFPFFSVKNAFRYADSSLGRLFECEKDMFYRFMNNPDIDWRRISYSIYKQLHSRTEKGSGRTNSVKCLIIDDTDLPKTGFKMENIGRVFSHVGMKSILGFKAMFMCITDGVSQFILDFSLHGEMGQNDTRPQGLTKKQSADRYVKDRTSKRVNRRSEEYLSSKIDVAISMIRRALVEGVRFDYLLVDSWFTCSELLRFIKSRHFACHLLGMIRMGKTKYKTENGERNASDIIRCLQKKKLVKYSRSIGYYHASIKVKFAGVYVMLHFYRKGKNGSWNALLTSDLSLDAKQAFRLYSRRWTIEVVHKDMKQNLKLGKSQCRDFAGQIAATTLCAIQYNILSYVKRFASYETLGGLFEDVTKGSAELSVAEKLWLMIIEVIGVIAEALNCDADSLMEQAINNDEQIKAVKRAFDRLATDSAA